MPLKRLPAALLLICFFTNLHAQTPEINRKVDKLISNMTLDEKIGQMTQVTMGVVAKGGGGNEDGSLDPEALKHAILDYKVGSILNTTAHALSVEKWRDVQTEIQDEAKKSRLQIPVIYGLDGMHGQTYTLNSTLFPQNIAMAATRNPDLVAQAAHITANELRASGVRWEFAPVLDCGRQPLWSRFPETFGEDVYIGKTMGATAIRAYQADGLTNPTAVAACMKHYLAYSAPRSGKDRSPSYIPEIELREYFLPQFREAIKAGAATIMINSGEINGVPVHASKYLLTDVLRTEMGFQGVIVTDWEDIIRLHTRHLVASSPRQAVVMAINAGIDMSMVPSDYSFFDLLKEAVQKNEVPVSRINDAVRRILILKYRLGLFDNAYPEPASLANFGKPEYQQTALQAAQEAMTLLKNQNNILPLSKDKKILVAGPSASSLAPLNGAWSYTWQGNQEQWYPADSKTIGQTIAEKTGGKATVLSVKGFDNALNFDTARLKSAAMNADVIVLCLGENAFAESPGNIRDLALPENQMALARTAAATGKPVILVLTEGRPRLITGIEPSMQGILMAYWSGKKTAEAVADVIFGDYNPAGILPFSYPRYSGEIVLYDRKHTEDVREIFNADMTWDGYNPLFPFGWGLSYTKFTNGPISLSSATLKGSGSITVSIPVTNSGARDGKHTIELYSHQQYASITPNMQRLRAFQKISLKAGETQTVSFTLTASDLAFVNAELKTVTEAGNFDLTIGEQKVSFSYQP
jgi:beta-glucosidase